MLWIMTEEEVLALNNRVSYLNNSCDLEDRICGMLMDMSIGCGLNENPARIKAKALAQLFDIWMKTAD